MPGSYDSPLHIRIAAELVAQEARPVAASARDECGLLAAPHQLPRAWPHQAEPRHGGAPVRCARPAAAAIQRAAGFAPAWAETKLDAARLAPIREALDYMLAQQEPYPAVVVDRRWNLLRANKGAVAMVEFLVGPIKPDAAINLADALVGPDVLRPHLVNWSEVVRYFVRSVEADALADATPETAALLDRLLNYKDVRATISQLPSSGEDAPILPMQFEKEETRLRLFTTVATLGTPQDITLQELRIESFFPMDEATREAFRKWAG
jgi:hypothetical protein